MKVGNIECYGVIYKIENKINGKVYIGQAKNGFNNRYKRKGKGIERVYNFHKSSSGHNRYILDSIEKYGFESFDVYEKIDVAFSKKELDIKEKSYIKLYKSNDRNHGYNMSVGGESPMSERRHSPLTMNKFKIRSELWSGSKSPVSKKVVLLNNDKVFDTITDASKFIGVKNRSDISSCCKGIQKSAGRFKDEKAVWMYYEDYLKRDKKYINKKLFNGRTLTKKTNKVVLLNTDEVFESVKEASDKYKIHRTGIQQCCRKEVSYAGVLEANPMVWVNYGDYVRMDEVEKKSIMDNLHKNEVGKSKQILLLNTGEIFDSISYGAKKIGLKSVSTIGLCCSGKRKSAGKINGEPARWMYYEDYLKLQEQVA